MAQPVKLDTNLFKMLDSAKTALVFYAAQDTNPGRVKRIREIVDEIDSYQYLKVLEAQQVQAMARPFDA